MTVDDRDIRSLLLARADRADRADARGVRLAVVEAARMTPQLRPLVRPSSPTRQRRSLRLAAGIAALMVLTACIVLVIGLRPSGEPGLNIGGSSPSFTPQSTPTATATDVPVTAPPFVRGSCPVTPISDLAGGVAPEVVIGGVRWRSGGDPWLAAVGHKVVLVPTSPSRQALDARVMVAERLPVGTDGTPLSVRYPSVGSPGIVFAIGLPEPGCWLLTAIGPGIGSSVVVEAGPAPANPQSAESQNVPTDEAALVPLAQCPMSPQLTGAPVRTWLDGDNRWEDPDPADWTAGMKRKLVVSGAVDSLAPYELVVATRVGIVGTGDSQRSAFVADKSVFTAPAPGSGSKAMELILPSAGCWAITYLDPAVTSTIVVENRQVTN